MQQLGKQRFKLGIKQPLELHLTHSSGKCECQLSTERHLHFQKHSCSIITVPKKSRLLLHFQANANIRLSNPNPTKWPFYYLDPKKMFESVLLNLVFLFPY